MSEKIKKYINSVLVEMKKVTWLSKEELISSTMIVGVFSILISIFLFVVDYGLSEIVSRLFGGK